MTGRGRLPLRRFLVLGDSDNGAGGKEEMLGLVTGVV